jgi:predicted nucleotidyltransferase
MEKDSMLSIRLPKEIKEKAVSVLSAYGYSLSSYINVMLKELCDRGYPQLELIKELRKREPIDNSLTFKEIRDYVSSFAKEDKKVVSVSLFGSYARDEATKKSDVDLHVVSDGTMSLIELASFENKLAKALHRKVDAVGSSLNGPETDFVKMIKDKEILLYER